jgi:proteasome lid subunit RPN8/RPN11
MRSIALHLPKSTRDEIYAHLRQPAPKSEEVAFCFAKFAASKGFEYQDHALIPVHDFAFRSLYHFELTDACRARIIKRAHDLQCSIIEFHSHPLSDEVEFSPSDLSGLAEFVPHAWWRLKSKPYAAVVVGAETFDSLVWIQDPSKPDGLLRIEGGASRESPTGHTFLSLERSHGSRPI